MSGIKHCIVILLLITLAHPATAQRGCTDPKAINYNPAARSNDGSCRYAPAGVALTNARKLPVKLNENSGLIYTSGGLWTLNDSGNPADFLQDTGKRWRYCTNGTRYQCCQCGLGRHNCRRPVFLYWRLWQ